MALVQKQFSDLITFSRASGGGRFNHLGQYEWLSVNDTPRFGYDPTTVSTSTSSVTVGAGQLTFAVTRQYALGDIVRVTADASNYLVGKVIAATANSVTLLVDSDGCTGSGMFSSWTLIVSRGLIREEQRTNLYVGSQTMYGATGTTVSTDSYLAPDGTMTADAVIENTANTEHFAQDRNISMVAGTAYTYSVFAKATGAGSQRNIYLRIASGGNVFGGYFSLSSKAFSTISGPIQAAGYQDLPNGWTRFWITFVAAATAASVIRLQLIRPDGATIYTGDGVSGLVLWGAQFEAGASPSLYIPTTSAQVTRAADQVSVNAVTAWLNPAQFTLSAEFASRSVASATPSSICGLNDGTANNRANLRVVSGQAVQTVTSGGADVVSAQLGAVSADVKYKVAAAFKTDDYAGSLAGAAPVADTAGALPGVTTLSLGGFGAIEALNGYLGAVRCVPRRITNAELQAVSA